LILCISGLVFTSPRAIRAVACIKDARSLLGGWQNHPVFVVGEGTSNILKKVLHLNGKGSSAGNASALADEILESELQQTTEGYISHTSLILIYIFFSFAT
jgi:uroporphyrinogen-III synthase